MTTDQMLMNNEQMTWKAIQDKRWKDFAAMLDVDYQGFYSDGLHEKAAEVAGVQLAGINNVTISDMKVHWISKDVAYVTALVKGNGMGTSGKLEDFTSRTTSIWKKDGKNWLIVYHSDIIVKPM
jgi:ketosteroid isomerase-like protein